MFQKTAAAPGIKHKLISPYTPRHNGKVERSRQELRTTCLAFLNRNYITKRTAIQFP
ncbi:MAG: integrase core domain-containing protein [Oscillospiraceae bacterium]|nr:integrase core domain-containing protein [Oscillospiraceae bacterium]